MKGALNLGRRFRELRKEHGLTLTEVAQRTQLSISLLSQVEGNKVAPSISTLHLMAHGLGVPMIKLFEEKQVQELTVRAPAGHKAVWRVLLSPRLGAAMTAAICNLPPSGKARLRRDGRLGSEDFGFVLSGEVRIVGSGSPRTLKAGEAIFCQAGRGRLVENAGTTPASLLWLSSTK